MYFLLFHLSVLYPFLKKILNDLNDNQGTNKKTVWH